MAATPVFISDLPTLKERLRISQVDTGEGASVVDSVVEEVRLELYAVLGSSTVTTIAALTPGDPATTDDELKRLRAENVELLMVRLLLMRRMPILFLSSVGQARQQWNEEGITRDVDQATVRREIQTLEASVRKGLALLNDTDANEIRAEVIVPDETPQRPGDSILPSSLREALRA